MLKHTMSRAGPRLLWCTEERVVRACSFRKLLPTAQASTPRPPSKTIMFTTWDLVRPRMWHPMASLEQSMLELDRMSQRRLATHAHFPLHDHDMHDDEFFSDLPVNQGNRGHQHLDHPAQEGTQQQQDDQDPANGGTFSSYSYSSSTIVDDKGQRVSSTRRRYEDSSGRLKAVHERQIGDKKHRTVWNRQHKDDEGKHEQTLLGGDDQGSKDAFEEAWKQTAFGEAAEKKKQEVIKEKAENA